MPAEWALVKLWLALRALFHFPCGTAIPLWRAIKTACGLSQLVGLLSCIPVGCCCQDLPVPTHPALDEPGTRTAGRCPRARGIRTLSTHRDCFRSSRSEQLSPQTLLSCLPNVPLKAASIATLFSCFRLKQHHLFCPHWAENIAYLFHSHLASVPWLLKGSLTLSNYFLADPSRKHCSSLDILI